MPTPQVDIEVGSGPVQKASLIGLVTTWLTFLLGVITTVTNNLPEGVDPAVGLGLTVAAGVIGTAIQAVLGLSRAKFADAKAKVMAGESGYSVLLESLQDTTPVEPTEPTDTNVSPPVEP